MIEEKVEKIKDNSSYSQELKDRIWERFDEAETERKRKIEALSINREKLRSDVSRISGFLRCHIAKLLPLKS